MEAIHSNPFRVLGLSTDASEKEIAKRVSDLEMYADMGKSIRYDSDFNFLSTIDRSTETIRNASNQIETADSRFLYSMFWFWNKNSVDDLVLDLLKEENPSRAISLLEKQLEGKQNSDIAFSNAQNLSILHMALARNNGSFSFEDFSKGLNWAGRILHFEAFSDYAKDILGNYFKIEKEKVVSSYVDKILSSVSTKMDKPGGIPSPELISIFSSFPYDSKRRASTHLTSTHLQAVEGAIEESEKKRKNSPENANLAAKDLYETLDRPINKIREALGDGDYSFQALSNKLAKEIDQCGTDYFNYHYNNDTGIDPGDETLKISRYARVYAIDLKTKETIDEGIETVKDWISGKKNRECQKKVKPSIDLINRKLKYLPDTDNLLNDMYWQLINIAEDFVKECKPELFKIQEALGDTDDFYISISSTVVNSAINLCIDYANETDDTDSAIDILNLLVDFKMGSETKERYIKNKEIFINNNQIDKYVVPIKKALESVPNISEININQIGKLPDIVDTLIDTTYSHLKNLKEIDAELYLNISSAVANTALNLCIEYANQTGDMSKVLWIMIKIRDMEMEPELKDRFNKNYAILNNNSARSKQSSTKSEGCYIATMVYGNYDSPQVLTLRKYRDEVMRQTLIGRIFITVYYRLSPTFVKYLGRFNIIHSICRNILDRITRGLA